jgi:hypothetical protein
MAKMRTVLGYTAVTVGAILLVGCGGATKEVAKDDVVLLTINKKPVLTKTEFYKELSGMIGKMDPAMLPKETQRKVMDDFACFKAVVEAAKKAGLNRDPEFIKTFEEQKNRLEEVTLVRFHDKKKFDELKVSVEDKRANYEQNKARYIKEQGGVVVMGVSFPDRPKAMAFYERAKGLAAKADEFASLAKKEVAGKFREFGRVSKEATGYSPVPATIKDAALRLAKLPSVDVVKDGKDTWVINVSDKKEPVFFNFEEIEDRIDNQLKVNKFMEQRTKMCEELKKELNVEINEAYFKDEKAEAPAAPVEAAKPAEAASAEEAPAEEAAANDDKGGKESL